RLRPDATPAGDLEGHLPACGGWVGLASAAQGESTEAGDAAERTDWTDGADGADGGLLWETIRGAGAGRGAGAVARAAGAWRGAERAAGLAAEAGEAGEAAERTLRTEATDWRSSGELTESPCCGAVVGVVVVVVVLRSCSSTAMRSWRSIRRTGASSPPLPSVAPRWPPTPRPAMAAVAPTSFHLGASAIFFFIWFSSVDGAAVSGGSVRPRLLRRPHDRIRG